MRQKEMLKASDIAPSLGVTTGRIYQLISAGVIPGVRIGRSLCIPRVAWERWLRERNKLAEKSTARRRAGGANEASSRSAAL